MMNRPRLVAISVFAVLLTALATSASASAGGRDDREQQTYYLSLGDSLAQGVQPDSTGASLPTKQGYADQLARIARDERDLRLVKMGCPGETSATMINGGICPYAHGSQLSEAVAFLAGHRHHVAFVTLDIGANDVDGCVVSTPAGPSPDVACIIAGFNRVAANLPGIAAALRATDPSNVIVAMNYYNPFLALWFNGPSGPAIAFGGLQLGDQFNALLGGIYAAAGVQVADVASAYSTDAFTILVPFSPPLPPGGKAPLDVVRICQWTWMCAPAPVGPNIHANKAGYKVIARTFAAKLGLSLDN
jgi:lysophospholipase L1-like esterase